MNCIICGEEIPEGEPINDAFTVGYIHESGAKYFGFIFVCTWDCFAEAKKRIFKDNKGRKLLFNQ